MAGYSDANPMAQHGGPPYQPPNYAAYTPYNAPQYTGGYPQPPQQQQFAANPSAYPGGAGGYGGAPAFAAGYQQQGNYGMYGLGGQTGYPGYNPAYGIGGVAGAAAHTAVPVNAVDDGWADMSPEKRLTADLDVSVRHAFVRKVYGILFVQLAVTFGVSLVFALSKPAGNWLLENQWLIWTSMALSFVGICAMACFQQLGRSFPTNIIILTAVSLGFGLMIGGIGALTDPATFALAAGITAALTLALTLFAFQTKWDFTGWGPFVFISCMVLMIFGLLTIFFHNRIMRLVYSCLGALLCCFYIIYDTQLIVGGKHHKNQYSIDDYAFAVLTLYMDIINLFLYILSIFANSEER